MGGLDLLDWRRRVAAIYADVRRAQDPAAAHADWVGRRAELFANHPQSPAAPGVQLRYATYATALRFETELQPTAPARIDIPTATDGVVPFERLGRVDLAGVGALDVWWLASYGGGVWLPMRDRNPETYGGGRYVLDTVKGADLGGELDLAAGRGTLVVDLNFAYNPSCAYDERWACPLAPEGNVLDVPVEAGELLPASSD